MWTFVSMKPGTVDDRCAGRHRRRGTRTDGSNPLVSDHDGRVLERRSAVAVDDRRPDDGAGCASGLLRTRRHTLPAQGQYEGDDECECELLPLFHDRHLFLRFNYGPSTTSVLAPEAQRHGEEAPLWLRVSAFRSVSAWPQFVRRVSAAPKWRSYHAMLRSITSTLCFVSRIPCPSRG